MDRAGAEPLSSRSARSLTRDFHASRSPAEDRGRLQAALARANQRVLAEIAVAHALEEPARRAWPEVWRYAAAEAALTSSFRLRTTPVRVPVLCDIRWAERTIAWLNQMRRLGVHYERRADIREAFLRLAISLVCLGYLVGSGRL